MQLSTALRIGLAVGLACTAACGEPDATAPDVGDGGSADAIGGEASAGSDARRGPLPDGRPPPHPKELPFAFERPESGDPLTDAEIGAATDAYLDLLARTRYLSLADERVHGWPESDPAGRYWYGVLWEGVTVHKAGGVVTYRHLAGGSDNAGSETGPMLEGACYAHLAWRDPALGHLARRLVRGMTSWILAMERVPDDPAGPLLTRAAYPEPVHSSERGGDLFIDYGLNRPGIDNDATDYVRIANNPYWGDIWIKNRRSEDDVGRMLLALAQVDSCAGVIDETGADDDIADLRAHYIAWARRVEDDGFTIATFDKNAELWAVGPRLTHWQGNAECVAKLATRLLGRGEPGPVECGNGLDPLGSLLEAVKEDNGAILRSFHEASVSLALLASKPDLARRLLDGMAIRFDEALDAVESDHRPATLPDEIMTDLLIHGMNVGVPLTWREVRFLHDRIRDAQATYPSDRAAIAPVFDPATPDGDYRYQAFGKGIFFRDLAVLVGACTSQWRNPASKPLLDCARLVAAGVPGG